MQLHKLDTETQVFFYEQEFYVLSNFSAFAVEWNGVLFPTAEHLYHWHKFSGRNNDDAESPPAMVAKLIRWAKSAHDAYQIAQAHQNMQRMDWYDIRVEIMRKVLQLKLEQHEYVRRKLLETGDRELIEDSWRDSYWGWGKQKNGKNMLGKLWMEERARLRDEMRRQQPNEDKVDA